MNGLCILVLLVTLSTTAQTNLPPICCRQPYRSLGAGQPVNLTPLFRWWMHQGDQPAATPLNVVLPPRPMTAWKRITGFKTGEVDSAWVINAEIATSPFEHTNEWILLKNPPVAEAAQYFNLVALIAEYQQQIAKDIRAQADYKNAADRDATRARELTRHFSKSVRWDAPYYAERADKNRAAAAAALNDQKATEQARDLAQQQLQALPSVEGRYQVNGFALQLGRNKKGQLIFDQGVPLGN